MLSTTKRTASLHDARLEVGRLRPGWGIDFVFSHIEVYVPEKGREFSVFSHRAVLECHNVQMVNVDGAIDGEAWVVDGSLPGGRGSEGIVEFGEAQSVDLGAGAVHLTFNTGAVIKVEAMRVSLSLAHERSFQEKFRE